MDKNKGTVHAVFESTDRGVILALGFISVKFPEFVALPSKSPIMRGPSYLESEVVLQGPESRVGIVSATILIFVRSSEISTIDC